MARAYHAASLRAAFRQVILVAKYAMKPTRQNLVVISCEHGGRAVPGAYASLLAGHESVLDSHRGWDPGALTLGRRMANALGVPLHAATTTRLLVELNRSMGHPQLFSEFTRSLPPAQRLEIIRRHYRPHRDAVEGAVARHIAAGYRVIHIASHSFTPVMHGVPRRAGEKAFAAAWLMNFATRRPALRLRRNYPYQGRADGLMSLLRKRFADDCYVGIELEVNQGFALAGGKPWAELQQALSESLAAVS